jgi:hypothetical protein
MRRQHWALLLLAVTTPVPSSGSAQPLPRACLDWRKDPQGPLPKKDVDNAVYRPILFKRADKKYDVDTYSDMSPVGTENCFRWEIVNSSPSSDLLIDELAWPAAGIRITRMRPGDANRDYNNRREQIPSAKLNNPVYAFEKEATPTLSWLATAQNAANQPDTGGGPPPTLRRTGELLPALKNAEPSIMNAIVSVVTLGSDRRAAPEISQVVGYGSLSIRITSRASIDGSTLLVSTDAVISEPPSGEARFNFPALSALKQTEPKSLGNVEEAQRFLDIFRDTLRSPESFRPEWNFRFPVSVRPGENVDIFRVRQPVIVSVGEERHCYLAAGYSPIPVGLTLQNCW